MTRTVQPLHATEGLQRAKGLAGPTGRRSAWITLLAAILTPITIAALLLPVLWTTRQPTSLDELVLAGPRPPGCVNLVIADDYSGSMTSFAAQRTAAENELVRWSRTNLQPDDHITVIVWAGTATVSVPPTRIDQLGTRGIGQAALSGIGDGTSAVPMIDQVAQITDTGCRVALMVISDSEIDDTDDPDAVRNKLGAAGVQNVSLLNPAGDVQSDRWRTLLPFTRVVPVDQTDPQQLSLALGGEVAAATGQHLDQRK